MVDNTDVQSFLREWAPRREIVANPAPIDETTKKTKQTWSSCLLVVSSASGSGRAARLAPRVARALSRYYEKVVVVPTAHHGHAKDILANEPDLSGNYDLAVVLGGDGAFSEALNGMLGREDGARVPLAQFPGGSGNAIAGNTLGVWSVDDEENEDEKETGRRAGGHEDGGGSSTTVERVCELLGNRKLSRMDANEVTCADGVIRYSALVLSGGNNADIVRVSDDYGWTAKCFGLLFRYVVGVFVALHRYGRNDNFRRLKLTINDEAPMEVPVFGFSLYNCGRTTRDAAFGLATPDGGTLEFVAAERYLGFLGYLKFLKAVKNVGPGSDIPNLFSRTGVTSIKVEPVAPEAYSDRNAAAATKIRPCYLGFDGNTLHGSDGERLAVPFSARVLPREIDVVWRSESEAKVW